MSSLTDLVIRSLTTMDIERRRENVKQFSTGSHAFNLSTTEAMLERSYFRYTSFINRESMESEVQMTSAGNDANVGMEVRI